MRLRLIRLIDSFRLLVLGLACIFMVLALDPLSADPTAPKTFYLISAASLLIALSALKVFWGAPLAVPTGPMAASGLALLACAAASFFFAPSQARSQAAFSAVCLLGLLAFSASDWLREPKRQQQLLLVLGASLGLACAWALVQAAGIDLTGMDRAARLSFSSRFSSRFGNPNFFGGFLLLLLPVAYHLSVHGHRAWSALVLLASALLLLTGSKAAWLGLGFQYFAAGHLHWHSSRPRQERLEFLKRWASVGALFAVLGLSLMPSATRARFFSALDLGNESVRFRAEVWVGSLKAAAARPFLGHGPGSFSSVYPAYRPPAAMKAQVQHSYEVTHAENWPLQVAVEYGLAGLAALLGFLFCSGRVLWKKAHDEGEEAGLALMLLLALGGALICNLAGLDLFLPSSAWYFSLLLGLTLARFAPSASFARSFKAPLAFALSAGFLLMALFVSAHAMSRWQASRLLLQAQAHSRAGNFGAAMERYSQALERDPHHAEALYFLGASQLDSGKPLEALASFAALGALAPDYVLIHDKKARAFRALGKMEEASREWERQIGLDPFYIEAVQELAGLHAGAGRLKEALGVLEAAQPRFPERADLQSNIRVLKKKLR